MELGCIGNAWHIIPKNGVYLVNPPYVESMINEIIIRIQKWLIEAKKTMKN